MKMIKFTSSGTHALGVLVADKPGFNCILMWVFISYSCIFDIFYLAKLIV